MKMLVTGATGFLGRHVVKELLNRGAEVVVVSRSEERARMNQWFEYVEFIEADVCELSAFDLLTGIDAVIHLAWEELDSYKSIEHVEKYLPQHYAFLKLWAAKGVGNIVVAGTCLEYGLANGLQSEDGATFPVVPYAVAKDSLRRYLSILQASYKFQLRWVRLFYLHGQGQRPGSLLDQLDTALERGDSVFNMSKGDQLRDFILVDVAAKNIASIALLKSFDGAVNCCSALPVSVAEKVEEHLKLRNKTIQLNLGFYPYPDYEPFAFWGDDRKLNNLLRRDS